MIDAPSFSPTLDTSLGGPLSGPLDPTLVVALTILVATTLVVFALLRAWQDWLELKRRELDSLTGARSPGVHTARFGVGDARSELDELKGR